MEMEYPEQDQDTDIMPKATEVTPQPSQAPLTEQVPSEKGDIVILEYNMGIYVYKITFNESQHRVVQTCKAHTSDEHASSTHFEEWEIVSYV